MIKILGKKLFSGSTFRGLTDSLFGSFVTQSFSVSYVSIGKANDDEKHDNPMEILANSLMEKFPDYCFRENGQLNQRIEIGEITDEIVSGLEWIFEKWKYDMSWKKRLKYFEIEEMTLNDFIEVLEGNNDVSKRMTFLSLFREYGFHSLSESERSILVGMFSETVMDLLLSELLENGDSLIAIAVMNKAIRVGKMFSLLKEVELVQAILMKKKSSDYRYVLRVAEEVVCSYMILGRTIFLKNGFDDGISYLSNALEMIVVFSGTALQDSKENNTMPGLALECLVQIWWRCNGTSPRKSAIFDFMDCIDRLSQGFDSAKTKTAFLGNAYLLMLLVNFDDIRRLHTLSKQGILRLAISCFEELLLDGSDGQQWMMFGKDDFFCSFVQLLKRFGGSLNNVMCFLLFQLGTELYKLKDFRKSERSCLKALTFKITRKCGFTALETQILLMKIYIVLQDTPKHNEIMNKFARKGKLFLQQNQENSEEPLSQYGLISRKIAFILFRKYQFQDSLKYYFLAERVLLKEKQTSESLVSLAHVYKGIGSCFLGLIFGENAKEDKKMLEKAEKFLSKSVKTFPRKQLKDSPLIDLANINRLLGDTKKAIAVLSKGVEEYALLGLLELLGRATSYLVEYLFEMGKEEEAWAILEDVIIKIEKGSKRNDHIGLDFELYGLMELKEKILNPTVVEKREQDMLKYWNSASLWKNLEIGNKKDIDNG